MSSSGLRPETEATLLLCGSFGNARSADDAAPLNVREFTQVMRLLERLSIPLENLLTEASLERLRDDIEGEALLQGRVGSLLDRGAAMALAVERWQSQGIWVLDRTHPDYPEGYRESLGDGAPPLLYGSGDERLLNTESHRLAIVGSRDIDAAAEVFARDAGRFAALAGVVTISGGAKGVDRIAMSGALEEGGPGIAILPGDLERASTSRAFRGAISDGNLVVVSPYHPRAKFTAGNAMGRNRLIYCLADVALVVSSGKDSGGTWSGATETLRNSWAPVFVRQSTSAPEGNRALLDQGAQPVEHRLIESSREFRDWLSTAIEDAGDPQSAGKSTQQLDLFSTPE